MAAEEIILKLKVLGAENIVTQFAIGFHYFDFTAPSEEILKKVCYFVALVESFVSINVIEDELIYSFVVTAENLDKFLTINHKEIN